MIVLPDTEDRTIVSSFVWTKTPKCDGRTDRIGLAITAVSIAGDADAL